MNSLLLKKFFATPTLSAALKGLFPAVILAGLLLPAAAAGEIYKWVDEKGVTHFQDSPPASTTLSAVEVIEESGRAVSSPPEAPLPVKAAAPPGAATGREPSGGGAPATPRGKRAAPEVELYTTSWCPYCRKAREYFRARGIAFTDYDIEKDRKAFRRRAGLLRQPGVPLAVINGTKILGFSPEAYGRALGRP